MVCIKRINILRYKQFRISNKDVDVSLPNTTTRAWLSLWYNVVIGYNKNVLHRSTESMTKEVPLLLPISQLLHKGRVYLHEWLELWRNDNGRTKYIINLFESIFFLLKIPFLSFYLCNPSTFLRYKMHNVLSRNWVIDIFGLNNSLVFGITYFIIFKMN